MTSLVRKRCDCAAARQPKCEHPWYLLEHPWGGQRYAPNLTRHARVVAHRELADKTDAEDYARDLINAIHAGTYREAKGYTPPKATPPPTVKTGATLDTVIEAFDAAMIEPDRKKRPNSKVNDRANLRRLGNIEVDGERLGDKVMAEIVIDDLIVVRAECDELAYSTWNKLRTNIGQVWAWALWKGHLQRTDAEGRRVNDNILVTSPKSLLEKIARSKAAQRVERFEGTLWDDILEAARELRVDDGGRFRDLLIALMETGARVGELLALQWKDVNLAARTIYIRAVEVGAGKTGKPRTIEISDELLPVLEGRQLDPAGRPFTRLDYTFGDAYGARVKRCRKAWETTLLRACRIEPVWTEKGGLSPASRAKLQNIDKHLHDIRHEAACRWNESGKFGLEAIQLRLGHATLAQTATYVHAKTGATRSAQQAYDAQRKADALAAQRAEPVAVGARPRLVKRQAEVGRV